MKTRYLFLALALTLAACTDAPMPTGQATAGDSPVPLPTTTLDAADTAASPKLAASTGADWTARDGDGEWCPVIFVGSTFDLVPDMYPKGPVYRATLHVWRGGTGQAADWSELNDGFSQADSLPHRIQFAARRAFSFGVPGSTRPNGWVVSDYSRGWRRSYSLDTEWRRFREGGPEPADHSYLDASGHKEVHARMVIDIPYHIRNVNGYMGPGKTKFWFFPREGFGDRFGDHPCDTEVKLNPKRLFRSGRS